VFCERPGTRRASLRFSPRWLYDHLLSGLNVPDEPSQGTVDAVKYVSLIGGLLELAGGLALLAWDRARTA
jgi:hypothetical protein